MAKAKAGPEQAPVPAPATSTPNAEPVRRRYVVRGPKGTWVVTATSLQDALDQFRNETGASLEIMVEVTGRPEE